MLRLPCNDVQMAEPVSFTTPIGRRALLVGGMLTMAGCREQSVNIPTNVTLPAIPGLQSSTGWAIPGVSTSDFSTGITILSFWATWCGYCRMESEAMMELSADRRIRLFGVAVNDSADTLRAYLRDNGNPYKAISIDNTNTMSRIFRQRGVPTKFLIGPDRKIVGRYVGPVSDANLMHTIKTAVNNLVRDRA